MSTRPTPTSPHAGQKPAITPYNHPAALDTDTLLAQCVIGRNRGSGPGGQHRNKVETLVELHHSSTGTEAHAGERRSVTENRAVAARRLRLALAIGVRVPVPLGEIGSALWRSRLQGGRIVCNPEHTDYPSLLAEALDTIYAAKLDVRRAAIRLGCTASQLIKLIKDHPPAMARLNQDRIAAKLHPLK